MTGMGKPRLVTTLTPFVSSYIQARRRRGEFAPATSRSIDYTLSKFADSFGSRPLNQLGPQAVERWQETLAPLAASTRRSYLSRAHSFTDWMLHQGHIKKDPFAGFKPITQPTPIPVTLTADEMEKLLLSVPDARARAIVHLEHGMGLRACEVARLTTRDWDQTGDVMLVRGKGGRSREMPVTSTIRRALLEYLAEVGERPGPLIRSEVKPWAGVSPKTLSTYMTAWLYAAGIKQRPYDGRGGHALRRTRATEIADETGDIRVTQSFLGHEGLGNLKHYIKRIELAKLRAAMEARDVRDPPAAA